MSTAQQPNFREPIVPVALARSEKSYAGLEPPFHPGKGYPEIAAWLGGEVGTTPNHVYAAVRSALVALGLDAGRLGQPDWNPLGDLVRRGGRVVLKPNFIRHWNPRSEAGHSVESVITHGSVVRAMADYAWLAVGPEGSVAVAEAPQMDCQFAKIREIAGLDEMTGFYDRAAGVEFEVIDLRREETVFRDGIIADRRELPGDPLGYRAVDLGERSFFTGSGLESGRFRGADYDPAPTASHHSGGRHEYLLSETVLSADLVVNLPKLKTHKKTGVTLAFKNLVGINGDKNWLPHHSLGSPEEGGDEYPEPRFLDRWRSRATEWARPWLARGRALGVFRAARRLEAATRGDDFVRAGNWSGNRTTWRMVLDLNRCFYYSDATGLHLDATTPPRTALTVLDGIVAGEGAGPLATDDRPLGVIVASTDPLAVDLTAVRLMGFDEEQIPKLCEAMRDSGPRITLVEDPAQVRVVEVDPNNLNCRESGLDEIRSPEPFVAHPGWSGAVERVIQ